MDYSFERYQIYKVIPGWLREILVNQNVFLAGGALTSVFSNQKINDLDFYFRSERFFENTKDAIESYLEQNAISFNPFVTKNARTYRIENQTTIQLIENFYGEPSDIYSKFDFTCCMAAFNFETQLFHFHESFFRHLSQKKLVYNTKSNYPISSFYRLKKFLIRKNFNIEMSQILKMAIRCADFDLNDSSVLKEQLEGVDIVILESLIKKLKNQENLSSEIIYAEIDEIYQNKLEELVSD